MVLIVIKNTVVNIFPNTRYNDSGNKIRFLRQGKNQNQIVIETKIEKEIRGTTPFLPLASKMPKDTATL